MSDRRAAQRLARETAILAGRLAALLDHAFPDGGGAADGRAFLRSSFASTVGGGAPLDFDRTFQDRRPEVPDPLDRLAEALTLTSLEMELCVMAGMPEEHEGYAAVFRSLHPRGEPRPTAGLAAQLFCGSASERFDFRVLLETGQAVASGALRLTGDAPLFERSLELSPALWPAMSGTEVWPAAAPRVIAPIVSAGLDEWLASPPAVRAASALALREACTILVVGDTADAAWHRAIALVARAGFTPAGFAPALPLEIATEQAMRLHTLARDMVPVIRVAMPEGPSGADALPLMDYPGTLVLAVRAGNLHLRTARPLITVTAGRLSPSARRAMWQTTIPSLADESTVLAARYPLEPAAAAAVAADLMTIHRLESRPATVADTAQIVRTRAGLSLSGGVTLVVPTATWTDLVLPEDRLEQLNEAIARLRQQDRVLDEWGFLRDRPGARGVRMLFAGPPGTGKTLSAEVLAHALGVDLLYVDISRVVSKWIGETEKNLAAIFETAERAQAVLFFDEADALFGKRTEVSDAHDRYANLETAYLLSRLEQFDGLTILATNLRKNIDPAFFRRLEFVIDFEAPDRDERHRLWKVHVPDGAPLADDVDLRELALLYPVVGAFIRNAATAAGFLAASNGGRISRGHFVHAIRREYEKSGRAFPRAAAGAGNS